jgi:hypothetical protein
MHALPELPLFDHLAVLLGQRHCKWQRDCEPL